jgi:hypothetical protein
MYNAILFSKGINNILHDLIRPAVRKPIFVSSVAIYICSLPGGERGE